MDRTMIREIIQKKAKPEHFNLAPAFAKDTNTILILRRNITAAIFDLHKITAACVFYDHILSRPSTPPVSVNLILVIAFSLLFVF